MDIILLNIQHDISEQTNIAQENQIDNIPVRTIHTIHFINKMHMIFFHLSLTIILLAVLVLQKYEKIAIGIIFLYMKIYICKFGGNYDPQIIMKITTIIFILSVLMALNFHIIYWNWKLNQLVTEIIKSLIIIIISTLDCIVMCRHIWPMLLTNSDNIREMNREIYLKQLVSACLIFILAILKLFFIFFYF
jgi:hypothetical protein